MNFKTKILELLLDKYERSKHYYGEATVNRRVILKMNRKEFPWYNIERTAEKEQIHSAVRELKEEGVVEYKWAKYETGNILAAVWLNVERIQDAYALAGRTPKVDLIQEVLGKLGRAREEIQADWIRRFLAEGIEKVEEKKELPRSIPNDQEQLDLLLQTLRGIDELGEDEMLERIFSRKYLGGSKLFEQKIRSRLVTLIREYLCAGEDVEAEEALELVGLRKTSEELLFFGPLVVELQGSRLDFSNFCYGASMNSKMIREVVVCSLPVRKVLTVENKATFVDLVNRGVDEDTLVVYLAGFYSPVKREFLQKVYDFLRGQEVRYYHWGDIDLGGFRIFVQLRQMIPELRPWKMRLEELKQSLGHVDPIDQRYVKSLEKLLERPEYEVFADVVTYMIEKRVRLEQEALVC